MSRKKKNLTCVCRVCGGFYKYWYGVRHLGGCCSRKCFQTLKPLETTNTDNVTPIKVPASKRPAGKSKRVLYAETDAEIETIFLARSKNFYHSPEWRQLRYRALETLGNTCMLCGASPRTGAVIHVDHILPRSIYPEKALDINNLQILCEDCNVGKSNKSKTDFRGAEAIILRKSKDVA